MDLEDKPKESGEQTEAQPEEEQEDQTEQDVDHGSLAEDTKEDTGTPTEQDLETPSSEMTSNTSEKTTTHEQQTETDEGQPGDPHDHGETQDNMKQEAGEIDDPSSQERELASTAGDQPSETDEEQNSQPSKSDEALKADESSANVDEQNQQSETEGVSSLRSPVEEDSPAPTEDAQSKATNEDLQSTSGGEESSIEEPVAASTGDEPVEESKEVDEKASSPVEQQHSSFPTEQEERKSRGGLVSAIILVLSTLLAFGAVFYFHSQEAAINEDVARLFAEGEAAAINGQLEEAKSYLEKARELRPNHTVIMDSLEEVDRAIAFEASFAALSEKIDNGELEEGEELLLSFQEELTGHHGVLMAEYISLVEEKQRQITLGKIAADLEEASTINELGEKLNDLAPFSTAEAEELRQEIIERIAVISHEEASEFLENYHFSRARATVIRGLELAVNNQELLELKREIDERQSAFTMAEQERLEEAAEMAAREDERNRTEAVDLTLFETELTEDDELFIYGEVVNQATRGIFNITIYYSVLDEDSSHVTDGHMYVTPEYLNPNDKGTFAEKIAFPFEYEELKVRIESITWELD
ncbi:MAG: hypothetical protein LRY73_07505 [Bacillus sp. (in: Bacteria)]|nr:hypothetical protein [Bacillus sp. (in: firmicutes)]